MRRNRTYLFMTIKEVANRIHSMEFEGHLDFTLDSEEDIDEPSGWFGIKKIKIFDEPLGNIAMGDYGAAATTIYSLETGTVDEIEEVIQYMLFPFAGCEIDTLCVEVPAKELWEEFGDVPMDPETECIEEEWNGFPAGHIGKKFGTGSNIHINLV